MSMLATQPVVSGRAYPIIQVDDQRPSTLDALVGPAGFVLDLDGFRYPVCGCGRLVPDGVRFFQKDRDGAGRDIRVWEIRQGKGGEGLVATHVVP